MQSRSRQFHSAAGQIRFCLGDFLDHVKESNASLSNIQGGGGGGGGGAILIPASVPAPPLCSH